MRYLVFAGERYYAHGGGNDYVDCFETFDGARSLADRIIDGEWSIVYSEDPAYFTGAEWAHVLDLETNEIVYKTGEGPHGDGKLLRVE